MQPDEEKRRVCTCNQQIDRTVVEDSKQPLRPDRTQAMIKSGGKMQDDKAYPIDGETGNFQRIVLLNGQSDKQGESNDAEHSTNAVSDAVGYLFTQGVVSPWLRLWLPLLSHR